MSNLDTTKEGSPMKKLKELKLIQDRITDILSAEGCCVSEAEYILAGVVLHVRGSALVQDSHSPGGLLRRIPSRGTEISDPFCNLPYVLDVLVDHGPGNTGGDSSNG